MHIFPLMYLQFLMIRCLNIKFSYPKLSSFCAVIGITTDCSDWSWSLMNIEYNYVWLGHDSTTLCDSTRFETPVTRDLTRVEHWSQWLVTRLGLDPHDPWLDSGLVPSDSSTALLAVYQIGSVTLPLIICRQIWYWKQRKRTRSFQKL